MKKHLLLILISLLIVTSCANPLNRVTSDNYARDCAEAESYDLKVAEEACYRALVNVDWGNLDPELKSERLYNLGRIKRRLSKFSEAEQLFKESLSIEEKLPSSSDIKIGRRLIELSISLAGEEKWIEGSQDLERAIPIVRQFSGQERKYAKEVFLGFSKKMLTMNQAELAKKFEEAAGALQ